MTKVELREALVDLGWALDNDEHSASRHFRFGSFESAFRFMQAVAIAAEELNHHPDWRNCYADVWITLTTHDMGGLTALDLQLARACHAASQSLGEHID